MPDINAYIMNPGNGSKSPEMLDRELVINEWSKEVAQSLSEKEGIELTQDHWRVINYLQEYYLLHGWPSSIHTMTQKLDSAFADHGGTRYLYQLFPAGPLAQGCRLAGLPVPHNAENDSFGSAQ
jgi:TusE/DsrC/DsvC family sulfur relay protein